MSIACNYIYLARSISEITKLDEIRMNRDQVIELFMNNPFILNFLSEKIHTYNRLLSMEYYKYVQVIATPIGKKIQIYPLVYDYYGVDLSDTTFYPAIFTSAERVIEYIDWLKRTKAEYLRDFRKWLFSVKTSIKLKTFINKIIFVFNDVTPELITYLDSINTGRDFKIAVLIVKKYSCMKDNELINITYYPWSL